MHFKIIISTLMFLVITKAFCQEKIFKIKGSIDGENSFKYAYAFDNNYKLIKAAKIENNSFLLKGSYLEAQRFGEPPFIKLFLSNEDSSKIEIIANNLNLLSPRKHFNTTIIAEKEVDVLYNSNEKKFNIKGNSSNVLQNQFNDIYYHYRKSRDSIYAVFDRENSTPIEIENKKIFFAKKLFSKNVEDMMSLIKDNPNSNVVLFNFSAITNDQSTSGKLVLNLYCNLSNELKKGEYGKYVLKDIEDKIKNETLLASPKYEIGMEFPSFELFDDKNIKTKDMFENAKYTMIDFWATWCIPCRNETPNLVKANNNFKAKGFKIITISIDGEKDKQKWLNVLKSDKMEGFTNLFNGNDKSGLARKLELVTIPANYLVDDKGVIVAKDLRGIHLEQELKKLFMSDFKK